ncbi:hypothetical protein [Streptomyces sp. NPDC014764]|uniref:hypothetical protein n=1 Tax=Streptomyces sp. NPDC014764 TaxID=3364907 RepID=UPI0036F9422A
MQLTIETSGAPSWDVDHPKAHLGEGFTEFTTLLHIGRETSTARLLTSVAQGDGPDG